MPSSSRSRRLGSWPICSLVAGLLAAGPGFISHASPAAAGEETAQASEATTTPAAGLRIYVDPLTGEFTSTPTRDQIEHLSSAFGAFRFQPLDEPVPFELRHGGTGVFVGNRFESATVVRVRPDGTFDFECAQPGHVHEILASPAPPADTAYAPR